MRQRHNQCTAQEHCYGRQSDIAVWIDAVLSRSERDHVIFNGGTYGHWSEISMDLRSLCNDFHASCLEWFNERFTTIFC